MKWILVLFGFFLCISCSSLRKDSQKQVAAYTPGEKRNWAGNPSEVLCPQTSPQTGQKGSLGNPSLFSIQRKAVDCIYAQSQRTHAKDETPVDYRYVLETKSNHPKVQKWIQYYSGKDHKRFQRFLNRGVQYKQMVQDLFVDRGLPPDLYYLGILESGYVNKAVSRAGAVGVWQFMAATAREYGLKINNYVDERRDPRRATVAASLYLKELYRQKKSWYLALASYNAGPGRVRRAMRRGASKNYWQLTHRRLLPYDTREYIPQFLAILYIGKDPERFGFVEKSIKELPLLELVKVPSPVKLKQIASVTGLSLEEIKKDNPHLLRGMTPPGSKDYHLWLRPDKRSLVTDKYAVLAKHRIKGLKPTRSIASYRGRRLYHRVRRGESLSVIAHRYGLSVRKLKKTNRLRSNRIYAGQKLRLASSGKVARRGTKGKRIHRYRIRRGDNLHKISKKFGLTINQIKRINNLKSDKIIRGRYLIVASNAKANP